MKDFSREFEEWVDIPFGAGIPTQTRSWMRARADLVKPDEIETFEVRKVGSLQAVAWLRKSGLWLHELPLMYEPSDLIWGDTGSAHALVRQILRQRKAVWFKRLPAASPTLAALQQEIRGRGLLLSRPAMPTPVINLEGRTPEDVVNKRRRSDLRRAQRKAEKLGEVTYEVRAPRSLEELKTLAQEAVDIEARSWKADEGTGLNDDREQEFFWRFMRAAFHEDHIQFAFLRIDGKAIAMQIASEWQNRFWFYKATYDAAYRNVSPGQLLYWYTLNQSFEKGHASYELMGGMADWTRAWTKEQRDFVDVKVFPLSPTGILALSNFLVTAFAKRVWWRTPWGRKASPT